MFTYIKLLNWEIDLNFKNGGDSIKILKIYYINNMCNRFREPGNRIFFINDRFWCIFLGYKIKISKLNNYNKNFQFKI